MVEYVQYIVVRKDLVPEMGVGKTAAQVAHASLGAVLNVRLYSKRTDYYNGKLYLNKHYRDHPFVEGWLRGRFTKLVVYIKSKEKLLNLAKKLDADGLSYKLIYDACFTKIIPEEEDGTTLTCLGVIPLVRDLTPDYLKRLQLLD